MSEVDVEDIRSPIDSASLISSPPEIALVVSISNIESCGRPSFTKTLGSLIDAADSSFDLWSGIWYLFAVLVIEIGLDGDVFEA